MLYLLFSVYGPSDFGNLFRALRGSTGFFMRPMAPSFFGSVLKLCSWLYTAFEIGSVAPS